MLRSRVVKSRLDWTLTSDLRLERRLVDDQLELLRLLHSAGRLEYTIQARIISRREKWLLAIKGFETSLSRHGTKFLLAA